MNCKQLEKEFEVLKTEYGLMWVIDIGLAGWTFSNIYKGTINPLLFPLGVALWLLTLMATFYLRKLLNDKIKLFENCGGEEK